jgi:hypothetical protein
VVVIVVAFQIIFRVEMHANDAFLFFKNYLKKIILDKLF